MNFLVDAQQPRRLAQRLQEAGHDALHTLDLPAGNRTTDTEINAISLRESRVVITKDADFVNSFLLIHQPYKLLVVSTGNITNAAYLIPILNHVHAFLRTHRAHDLIYGEEENFIPVDTLEFLDWIEDADRPIWMPRHFTERFHFTQWREVAEYLRDHPDELPWWWGLTEIRRAGRRKFEQLILAQLRLTR
jgi:predicted nuclease of predicted toxin-antitoxin system